MKKILATIALALGLTLVAMPAHAAKPRCYTVAALPDQCLTLATYTYLNGLTTERDLLRERVKDVTAENQQLWATTNDLHDKLFRQSLTIDPLREKVVDLRLTIERRDQRIVALRAKVMELRLLVQQFVY
jgi:hypothetical protein